MNIALQETDRPCSFLNSKLILSKKKTDFRIISMGIENISEYRYNLHNVTCFKNYVSTLYLNVPAEIKFGQILSLQRDFAWVAGPKTPLVCHWKNIVNPPFELPGFSQGQMMSEDIFSIFFPFVNDGVHKAKSEMSDSWKFTTFFWKALSAWPRNFKKVSKLQYYVVV